jgi:NADH-quinone oxidoreductase subunit G
MAAAGADVTAMIATPRRAYVVGGVDTRDLADPAAADAALAGAFVVSLELRPSTVTDHADVVLPVAAVAEKAGAYVDWEGRIRPFAQALPEAGTLSDGRVLSMLADALGAPIGLPDVLSARAELDALVAGEAAPVPAAPAVAAAAAPRLGTGKALLASHHHLLDEGSLQDAEEHLAGTRPASVCRLSAATAAEIGVADGESVAISTARGTITLPLAVTDLPDRVVWVPTASAGSHIRPTLGALPGTVVSIRKGALG